MAVRDGRPALSIVVPVLNEAGTITRLLEQCQPWRAAGDEVIVVDGGSSDDTFSRAAALADRVLDAPRGRARQQNAGAAHAGAPLLWFVHADSDIAGVSRDELLAAAAAHPWGRCAVRIDDPAPVFRCIEAAMNLRTRLTSVVTGDHGIYVRRSLFDSVGGMPELPLMEDVAFSALLARHARVYCLTSRIATSARRWRQHGILRTVLLMWALRAAWFCGVPAARLARLYGYRPA